MSLAISVVLLVLNAAPVAAQTRNDLDQARERVQRTQAEADAIAARYEEAVARYAELTNEADRTRGRIKDAEQRQSQLQAAVRELAVTAYTGRAAGPLGAEWLDATDAIDARRRSYIL